MALIASVARATPGHSMRVVRSPDSSVPDTSQTGGAGRASQLFSEYILKHRLVQRQLGHQLLQRVFSSRSCFS